MEYLVPAGLLTPSSAERDGATDSVVTARDGVNLATDGVIVEALAELRHALGRAEGELAAEQRRGAELVATLTTALDRERARADRLEAEALALARALAEARRPWLARVLEGLRRKGS